MFSETSDNSKAFIVATSTAVSNSTVGNNGTTSATVSSHHGKACLLAIMFNTSLFHYKDKKMVILPGKVS